MKELKFAFFVAFVLSGCVAIPVATVQPTASSAKVPVKSDSVMCVIAPPDASFEGAVYSGSGREIAEKIQIALQKAGRQSRLVSQTQHDSILPCKEKGATHVVETAVLRYEDRATGWSGKPDRIELRISLYDFEQPHQRSTITYQAQSSMLASAFLEWGNAKPTALLGQDFEESINKLMGGDTR